MNTTQVMRLKADMEVVYKDMKLGFLAGDTDHGTREVREIFKGELNTIRYTADRQWLHTEPIRYSCPSWRMLSRRRSFGRRWAYLNGPSSSLTSRGRFWSLSTQ